MPTTLELHLRRPRLTALLRDARIGVIEAAGGYGKSSLAAELREVLASPALEIVLPVGAGAGTLVARIGLALRRIGASDLATAVAEGRTSSEEAIEALLAGLAGVTEPWLVILDDVHEADPEAAGLILRLVSGLPEQHRALVAGRAIVHPLARLRRDRNAALVDGDDLLFTAAEVQRLLGERLAREVSQDDARTLRAATGGWAAALVLSTSLLARAGDPGELLGRLASRPPDLTRLVQESLRGLPEDTRDALVQLAHLPDPGPDLAEAAGAEHLLRDAVAAGFPLTALRDGGWSMPNPVAEILVRQRPLSADVARRAAPVYLARNELGHGARVLLRAGAGDDAAALLASLTPDRFDAVDLRELEAIVDSLPREAVERHPRLLAHLARAYEVAAETRLRARALTDAVGIVERDGAAADPAVVRELQVELARDHVRDGRPDEAERLASAALAAAGPDEQLLRARALHVLGSCAAWRAEPDSLLAAERLLVNSLRLCRTLGQHAWASQVTLPLAISVQFALGRFDAALRTLDEGLAELPLVSRQRAVVLTFRGDVLVAAARADDAEADLDEAGKIADLTQDDRSAAYCAWGRMKVASLRTDPDAVIAAIRTVERHLGDWFEHNTGVVFLGDAADALDRADEIELGAAYLVRAVARGAEAPDTYAFAQALMCARACVRSGATDQQLQARAAEAEAALIIAEPIPPREAWRVALIRAALAIASTADGAPDADQAVRAFEEAAALGIPELPLLCEPLIGERLLPVALARRSAGAREASRRAMALSVRALGGFEVRRGRTVLELPPGKPEELVKLLAVEGGRLATDEAIEALWPEVEEESGRKRLRNVLNRLRDGAGELVLRDGESLTLPPEVDLDAQRFEAEARRALAAPAGDRPAAARAATARYRGELLPDDRYATWAAGPRERLQRRHRALLDLLVVDAEAHGDLDEALRLLDRTIESDPFDEEPYLTACRLLLAQGRRAAAVEMLGRARGVIEQLAIPAPPALLKLERAVSA